MCRVALTCTPLCVRQATKGKILCHRELGPALCDNLDGWAERFKREGTRIPVADSQVYRDQHNIVKQLSSN